MDVALEPFLQRPAGQELFLPMGKSFFDRSRKEFGTVTDPGRGALTRQAPLRLAPDRRHWLRAEAGDADEAFKSCPE